MSKVIYVSGYQDNFPELLSIGKQIDWVQNGMIAISAVQSSSTCAVIIEDNLPLMTPSRLIKELSATKPNLPIILIIRTEERRKQIIDDFKLGIFGWYEPEHNQESDLNNLLDQAINFYQFFNNLTPRNQKDMSPVGYSDMVGISNSMLSIYRLLAQIRNKDVTTLLLGESGTGKNLAARTLHDTGLRRDKPFVHVNCPAIPSELLESELFGHEKGAFTGADERKDGKFLAANSGTIFLDEIGDMSPSLQAKILRVLESGEIERVGGAETHKVDVRIISATNQNLEAKIQDGSFRQDLYHRINVFPINLPCLRERPEDVPPTTFAILDSLAKKHKIDIKYITPGAMELLKKYSWPGNIRELENSLERIVLISDKATMEFEDVKTIINQESLISKPEAINQKVNSVEQNNIDENSHDKEDIIKNSINLSEIITLKEIEYKAIIAGLNRTNWNLTLTAEQLGISRMTLYRKLEQHDLRKKEQ